MGQIWTDFWARHLARSLKAMVLSVEYGEDMGLEGASEDVMTSLVWLSGKGPGMKRFDRKRVAVVGCGVGAAVALRSLERYNAEKASIDGVELDVKVVALVDPALGKANFGETGDAWGYSEKMVGSINTLLTLNTTTRTFLETSLPTMVVASDRDPYFAGAKASISSSAGPVEFKVFGGVQPGFVYVPSFSTQGTEASQRLNDFLLTKLDWDPASAKPVPTEVDETAAKARTAAGSEKPTNKVFE